MKTKLILSPGKKPRQARSREMRADILPASIRVLKTESPHSVFDSRTGMRTVPGVDHPLQNSQIGRRCCTPPAPSGHKTRRKISVLDLQDRYHNETRP